MDSPSTTYPEVTAKLTSKQQEIRRRDGLILDAALPMIREGGASRVNMDTISRAIGCTRGTIYNHYRNKEDIFLALATRSVQRRMALFQYASTLGDHPRHCCAAIGIAAEVYADHLVDDFQVEQITRHDPVWQKTSPGRRKVLASCEASCIEAISRMVARALQTGDLRAARGVTHEQLTQQLVFGLWSLVYGGLLLESTSPSLKTAGITQPRQAIRLNCNALLDNLGWQPAYDARRYNALVKRITPLLRARAGQLASQSSLEPGRAPTQ